MKKPVIGITMGEPAGIGPEISIKTLCEATIRAKCNPFILGDLKVLQEARVFSHGIKSKNKFKIVGYQKFDEIPFQDPWEIPVLDFNNINLKKLHYGKDSQMGGRASGEYIKKAIELAIKKKIAAVVTGPISKVSFKLGGWGSRFVGHTEMFASLTRTKKYAMLLADGNFRVIHVTTHTPLKDVSRKIKKKRIIETIELANLSCRMLGVENPRIAVCGFNPHAGESGKIGREEEKEIIPGIEACKRKKIRVTGPLPADTMWSKVLGGQYDIGVAMYHDQGHIPLKLLGFQFDKTGKYKEVRGINVTIGLPMIRVSVDHGVAYGKAGKGIASHGSMMQALETAIQMSKGR